MTWLKRSLMRGWGVLMPNRLRAWAWPAFFTFWGSIVSAPASAQETIIYTYDAQGRLVLVSTTSTGNAQPISSTTNFDPAGNRSSYTVEGVSTANLAISGATVTEGGTLAFTVTRSGNTAVAASAGYTTADGTATAGNDYTAASGTVNFAAGQTTATINIVTIEDTILEPAETMSVTLSGPSAGAQIQTASATGTINDKDSNIASLGISDATASEGSMLSFMVTRSGNTAIPASASYATYDNDANAGSDYTATSGTVTFAAGQTTAYIYVTTLSDTIQEPTELMNVKLSSPSSGASIIRAKGIGRISDGQIIIQE